MMKPQIKQPNLLRLFSLLLPWTLSFYQPKPAHPNIHHKRSAGNFANCCPPTERIQGSNRTTPDGMRQLRQAFQ